MTDFPRLHIVATNSIDAFTQEVSLDDSFAELFVSLRQRAEQLLDTPKMTAAIAWELAQYTDMVDAGYGDASDVFYHRATAKLTSFVLANLEEPTVRSMLNRTAGLSKLVDWVLDQPRRRSDELRPLALAA